jgi:glc operon protein GlcG
MRAPLETNSGFLPALMGAALLAVVGRVATVAAAEPEPLVTRGRVELNLAGAEHLVAAAKRKAAEMKLNVNIAVVDDGGHLLAFARMDGARPASAATAQTKAVAAATMRVPTGPVRRGDAEPDLLLNLSLQNAAAAGGGKMTGLLGGLPIVVDGQVIGAVGVGGGTGEQDVEIGRAGIESLLEAIK